MTTCTAPRHDTPTAYQAYGCRCPEARAAQARYRKQLRHADHVGHARKVDATGARRRIQALMANGWSSREIMRRLGYSDGGMWLYYADRLNVTTVERIKALYDDLWDQPGASKWTRTFAANRGFLPPLAWDDDTIDDPHCQPFTNPGEDTDVDEIAVERFIAGDIDWREVSTRERLAAAIRMDRAGHSRNDIEARVHVNRRRLLATFDAGRPLTHTEAEQWAQSRKESAA